MKGLPSRGEALWCALLLAVWLGVTALFVGFRPEHPVLAVLIFVLFYFTAPSRRLVVALAPFFIFAISYDWMNILPNYEVNPVDVKGLYDAEKNIFGISSAIGVLSPNEFFALHHAPWMDFLAGAFYLCWVPLPVIFGLWLYFSGRRGIYTHFAWAFLFVNLCGFALYYVHPAAPPWYVAEYGFEAIPGTGGSVAGLGRFDQMTGLNIFNSLYVRNSNVFAAFPSLHSAYTFTAFLYSLRRGVGAPWRIALGVVSAGIWFTAVYTSHHYIIDVLGGIAVTLVAVLIFEKLLLRIPAVKHAADAFTSYISPAPQNGK